MFIGSSSIALFLAVILLFAGFASSLLATAQQTTTTPLLPSPSSSPPPSSSTTTLTTSPLTQPITPEEQEQLSRLQNVIAATNQNLDETEKQIGGIVYTPRWSDPVWVEPDSASVLVAYCLPGEFAESGQEILGGSDIGGFELEVLESYEVALPQNFTAWMMVIGNEDRQNRYPAAVGVICASDANNAETRVVSPQEQQQINNVVQQITQVTSIDQVINIINRNNSNNTNNNATNQNTTTTTPSPLPGTTTPPPPGGTSGSSGVGGITISNLDIEFLPSDLTPVDVRAEISGNTYNGPCPVTTEISGTITDNVGNRDVTYRVIGSHGGVMGETPIHFSQPGSQSFSTKFSPTLGEGWAAIEILQPIDANLLQSNRVEFQITCTPSTGGQTAPPGGTSNSLGGITIDSLAIQFITPSGSYVYSNTYNGPCPVTASISGTITDNVGNRDVTYRLIRSDGGVPGEAAIHFSQPGSEIVFFDSDIATSFQGWAAIEITQPVQLQSNRVEFQITCTPSTGGQTAPPGGTSNSLGGTTEGGGGDAEAAGGGGDQSSPPAGGAGSDTTGGGAGTDAAGGTDNSNQSPPVGGGTTTDDGVAGTGDTTGGGTDDDDDAEPQ